MGIKLDLIDDLKFPTRQRIVYSYSAGHLQKIRHAKLRSVDRNVARADHIRQRLNERN